MSWEVNVGWGSRNRWVDNIFKKYDYEIDRINGVGKWRKELGGYEKVEDGVIIFKIVGCDFICVMKIIY